MSSEIITLIGLLITIVGCCIILRKLFPFTSGKAEKYKVSFPGWIVTGIGCLICSVSSGHYSAICAWAILLVKIWLPIVLNTQQTLKNKSRKGENDHESSL